MVLMYVVGDELLLNYMDHETDHHLLAQVFFVPAFFRPPDAVQGDPVVDGLFSWNSAWPSDLGPITLSEEDQVYLKSVRPSPSVRDSRTCPHGSISSFAIALQSAEKALYDGHLTCLLYALRS